MTRSRASLLLTIIGSLTVACEAISRVTTTPFWSMDPCRNFQCQNGGFCIAPADWPYCSCPPGYTGRFCEVSLIKPGTCPKITFILLNPTCTSPVCQVDPDCPGEEKCCFNSCGSFVCTQPLGLVLTPTCVGGCPPGFSCVLQTPPCQPGFSCLQALLPMCVPDGCANCKPNEGCRLVTRCNNQPGCVDKFRCVPKRDPCGGCRPSQVCLKVNTTSNLELDDEARHVCVPNNPCGGCPPGQTCQEFLRPCMDPCRFIEPPCTLTVSCSEFTCYPDPRAIE